MGPNGLNTLKIVAGVVVDGMDPIQRARVGELCSCASIPLSPPAPDREVVLPSLDAAEFEVRK